MNRLDVFSKMNIRNFYYQSLFKFFSFKSVHVYFVHVGTIKYYIKYYINIY